MLCAMRSPFMVNDHALRLPLGMPVTAVGEQSQTLQACEELGDLPLVLNAGVLERLARLLALGCPATPSRTRAVR